MSQKGRIQEALLRLGKQGRFFKVLYRDDGTPTDIDPDGQPTKPQTCLCNETDAEFATDPNMGRRRARKRVLWKFKLVLGFPCEVNAENFEQDVMDEVLTLPPTDTLPSVFIEIADAEYDHPTTKDPGNGSRIEYSFEAVEGRR